jgi:ribosome biogenesis GTPase / thiamine phosphate phosphatase
MSLERWGWNSYFAAQWREEERGVSVPARVIEQQRGFWKVATEDGELWAEATGKLRLAADDGGAWPAVGDWVAVEVAEGSERGMIQSVLPRRSCFVRKEAGKKVEQQVLAANVDVALLVCALDGDFSARRLERYLAQCWESGVRPVVVLNKADVCEDIPEKQAEVERILVGAEVLVVAAKTGEGIAAIETMLKPGMTFVLLGSSGVGKSTIVNRLMGAGLQETQPVRESNSKGRHTTTAREIFSLPGGALLMDTPGMREFQLWEAAEGVAQAFADIDELASRCKFHDCSHEGEPGCAVLAAVEAGTLELARLESRRKLLREEEFLRRKIDASAEAEYKQKNKTLHRGVKKMYEQRKKEGGKP